MKQTKTTYTTYATTEVRFRHLSTPLKIAIITAWTVGCLYVLAFLAGFFIGLFS